MFFEAVRQVAATLDHVRTSLTFSGYIIPGTPKRHATAFRGFWSSEGFPNRAEAARKDRRGEGFMGQSAI